METTIDSSLLAMHILFELNQTPGANLDTLAARLGVRRANVRAAVTSLHHEGYVNALRMRVTLAGMIVARGLRGSWIKPFRVQTQQARRAA